MLSKEDLIKLNQDQLADFALKQAKLTGFFISEKSETELDEESFNEKINFWKSSDDGKELLVNTMLLLRDKYTKKLYLDSEMNKILDELILKIDTQMVMDSENNENEKNKDLNEINNSTSISRSSSVISKLNKSKDMESLKWSDSDESNEDSFGFHDFNDSDGDEIFTPMFMNGHYSTANCIKKQFKMQHLHIESCNNCEFQNENSVKYNNSSSNEMEESSNDWKYLKEAFKATNFEDINSNNSQDKIE